MGGERRATLPAEDLTLTASNLSASPGTQEIPSLVSLTPTCAPHKADISSFIDAKTQTKHKVLHRLPAKQLPSALLPPDQAPVSASLKLQ